MAIITTMTLSTFMDAFKASQYKDNFSDDGLIALFNELETMSDSVGEDINMDKVAFACEYSEDSEQDVLESYELADLASLQECTFAIKLDNGNVLYRCF